MKKHKALSLIIKIVLVLIALLAAFIAGFLIYSSVTQLKVSDSEVMEISGSVDTAVSEGSELKLMSWNVGYGALDERQDCYWDGGTGVYGESAEIVNENIDALESGIAEVDPDIFFLQELDVNSKRSYYIDELASFRETFGEDSYDSTFARNFKAGFVPLPLYSPTGKVEAGIATFSKYDINSAERVQLPIPFAWPMSMLNLKRCMLVSRIPVENSERELVLINLHLEAYDDGEGKAKQLAMLMNLMQEEYGKGNYVIAGGDFNQTFSNSGYEKYPQVTDWVCPVIDTEDYPKFTFLMDGTYPTCRSLDRTYADSDKTSHQYWILDGFILSGNIKVDDYRTLDTGFKNTDHNPAVLTIELG